MAINLSQLSEEASQPQGSWWSRTLEASKKQAEKEKWYTPLDFAIKSLGASPEASRAQAQSEKDMGLTDYMQKSAEIPFKSLVSVPTRAITYWENILATGEDILWGKYFWTEVPSWQESAEKRRQEAKAQEERTFNLFDFSKSEQETARTAVDFWATALIWGTLAKGGSLFARTATNATIWAGAMVPFTTLTEGRLPTAWEYAIWGGLWATLWAFGKGTETGRQITKDFTKPAIPKVEKWVEAEAEKIVWKTVPAQYGKKQVNIAPPIKHWYTAIGDKLAGITPERLINSAFKPTNLGKSAKRILYWVKNLANDTAEYIWMVRTGKLTGEIDDLQGFAQSLVENQDIVGKKIWKAITKLEWQATISEETMGKITNTLAKDYEQATPAYTILSNVKNLLSKARTYQDLWNIKSIFWKEVENLIKSGGNASESFRVLADVVHELDNMVTNKMSKLKWAEYRWLNRQYALIKRLSLTAAKSANVDMRRAPETLAEQIGVIWRIYSWITSPIATTDKMLAKFVSEASSRGGAYKRFLEITDQKAIDLAKTLKTPKKQNLLKPKTTTTSVTPEVNVAYQKNIADKYGKDYGIPEEDITASVKEIQEAYPESQIRIVDNLSDSEWNTLAGMFDPNTKEILISKEWAMKTTAWHEQAHSSLDSIKSQNPERYASIESEATKIYGSDWEEHVAEEAFYFMKRGQFKSGNIGTALKEFVVNLVNEMKAVFGKGDAVRKFQSDLTKGKLNNKWGKSLFPEKGEIKKQIKKDESHLIEEARKYKTEEDFLNAQNDLRRKWQRWWSAPWKWDMPMDQVLKWKHNQPGDYFDIKRTDTTEVVKTKKAIQEAKKTWEIKIYRAVNKNIDNFRDWDWVYLNEGMAHNHWKNALSWDYKILSKKVKNNQVFWDWNDINEWWYDNGSWEKKLKKIYIEAKRLWLKIPEVKNIDNDLVALKTEARRLENESEWDKLSNIQKKIFKLEQANKDLLPIKKQVAKEENPLFEEARKYKSADEFIEKWFTYKPPKKLYRWVAEDVDKSNRTELWYATLWKGLYTTPDKSFAKKFWKVEEFSPKFYFPRNPLVIERPFWSASGALKDWLLKKTWLKYIAEFDKKYGSDYSVFLQSLWYDWAVIWDEIVKYGWVKSEWEIKHMLSKIYNEAHSSSLPIKKQIAWEVEARNVQKRMNMSMQERLKNMPETTEDVQKSKQIVRK